MGTMINRRRICGGKDKNILLKLGKDLSDKSIYKRTTSTSGNVIPNHNNMGILLNAKTSPSYLILDTGIKNAITNKDYSISLDFNLIGKAPYYNYNAIISLGGSNTDGGCITQSSVAISWYAKGHRINGTGLSINYNEWHNVEFKRQNGYFSLYLDGVFIGESDYSVNQYVSNFYIGANQSSPHECMNGYVKNVLIKLL